MFNFAEIVNLIFFFLTAYFPLSPYPFHREAAVITTIRNGVPVKMQKQNRMLRKQLLSIIYVTPYSILVAQMHFDVFNQHDQSAFTEDSQRCVLLGISNSESSG